MGDNNTTPTYRTMKLGFAFLAFMAIAVVCEADWQEDHDVSPHHSTYAQVTELYDSMLQKPWYGPTYHGRRRSPYSKEQNNKAKEWDHLNYKEKNSKELKKKVAEKPPPCHNKWCKMQRWKAEREAKCRRRRTKPPAPFIKPKADEHPVCVKIRKDNEIFWKQGGFIPRRSSYYAKGGFSGSSSGYGDSGSSSSGRRRGSSTSSSGRRRGSGVTSGGSGS